jgi:hypothetical protein
VHSCFFENGTGIDLVRRRRLFGASGWNWRINNSR